MTRWFPVLVKLREREAIKVHRAPNTHVRGGAYQKGLAWKAKRRKTESDFAPQYIDKELPL